ncbi:single-stranded DNA-binding protein [Mycoplasmatota bacterium]|nr:single-stranded DNA-binding protein [Mycoplasmatota bacterium]
MINRVVLVGRLTKDPELRYTNSNIAVGTFTLAVNRNFASQDGSREADFIQCVVWRKQAENVGKYLHKGSLAGVDGRIQTRSYETNEGTRRYITEVVCDNVRFLDSRESAGQRDFASKDNHQSISQFKEEKEDPFFASSNITIDDDDLPF